MRKKWHTTFKKFLLESSPLRTARQALADEKKELRQFKLQQVQQESGVSKPSPRRYKLFRSPEKDNFSFQSKQARNSQRVQALSLRERQRDHNAMLAMIPVNELTKKGPLPVEKMVYLGKDLRGTFD